MTIRVKKIGGSVAVLIPNSMARELGLSEGTSLDVTATSDTLVMRKEGRRPRRSLKSIVDQIRPADYRRRRREALDTGPVGKEVW
jgi:antitoxin component of MazEF toxin-antitoxin module